MNDRAWANRHPSCDMRRSVHVSAYMAAALHARRSVRPIWLRRCVLQQRRMNRPRPGCREFATIPCVTVIPQRELRNHVSTVLKRAEQGEHFTVTVDGRPVAEVRPLPAAHKPAAPDRLSAVLGETPVDAEWARELRELRSADAAAVSDPWAD